MPEATRQCSLLDEIDQRQDEVLAQLDELNNLAAQQPDQVRQLTGLWQQREDQFREQAGPPDPPKKQKPRGKQ